MKEYRLAEVMSLLGSVGFDLYQSDPDNLTSQLSTLTSPILSPLSEANDDISVHLLDLTSTTPISTENGAVLTRSRSDTNASGYSSRSLSCKRTPHPDENTEEHAPARPGLDDHNADKPAHVRSSSHSPSGCEVAVLDPDLTCIGLSDDNADVWGLKIIKLVAYPDLIPVAQPFPARVSGTRRPMLDADDLASVSELGVKLRSAVDTSCEPETDSETDDTEQPSSTSDAESETTENRSDSMTRVGDSPIDSRESSQSPIFDMESPRRQGDELESEPSDDEVSLYASPAAFPSELIDDDEIEVLKHHSRRPQLLPLNTDKAAKHSPSKRRVSRRSRSHRTSLSPAPPPLVPFFSFTRTPEGSSLTAPVNLLAALFPPCERHMVICSGELDVLDSRAGSPDIRQGDSEDGADEDDEDVSETLKCLQIDLTKFGLGGWTRAFGHCAMLNADVGK